MLAITILHQGLTFFASFNHAFNLEDEDMLYEQLAKSVDQRLIEDIYLDSRRKLRAGVRQGAEVLVKDVELVEMNPAEDRSGDGSARGRRSRASDASAVAMVTPALGPSLGVAPSGTWR